MKNKIFTRKHNKTKTHFTRKNKKKPRKHNNKKNTQLMMGGKPKINFPYTYFILNFTDFSRHKTILNPYLNGETNACNNISLGQPADFKYDNNVSFLKDNNDICILVLKYDDVLTLRNNLNLLDDISFLNKILGHAKLTYYTHIKVISIYNVCLHKFDILLNQDGSIKTQEKLTKEGYGSVLFNCILTSITFLKLPVPIELIWVGIDVNNVNFKKVAWIYTSKGFENPIFSNISPDGTILDINFIQLTKTPNKYINNQDDALIPYYDTIDLHNQIYTNEGKQGIFSFTFNFDKSAILSIRLMPFYSFEQDAVTQIKRVIGIEDFVTQRETAGNFINFKSYENNNAQIINNLSLETIKDNSSIKFNIGESGTVNFLEGQRLFHTHPFINYSNNKVLIGPPSGSDFQGFTDLILGSISSPIKPVTQFTAVITIEGIYIYSISISGILNIKKGNIPKYISTDYEYPNSERYYDWSNYNTDITIQENAVKDAITKYSIWFNRVNNKNGDFFVMQFLPWNKFDKNSLFTIHYYNSKRLNYNENSLNYIPMDVD
jgi:hypothetical protein